MTNIPQQSDHHCGRFSGRSFAAAIIGSAVVSLAIQGGIILAFG